MTTKVEKPLTKRQLAELEKAQVNSPSDPTQAGAEGKEIESGPAPEASQDGEDKVKLLLAEVRQLTQQVNELQTNAGKLNTFQSPEKVIEAARKREEGDYLSSEKSSGKGKSRSIDVNNPASAQKAWPENLVVRIKETSSKYNAYKLDSEGEPVKAIFEYQCNGCSLTDEAPKGEYSKKKRKCRDCGSDLILTRTAEFEPGTPALGVIRNFMYTNKKGVRKYKVYFEKFSANLREEGLLETEMVPVR